LLSTIHRKEILTLSINVTIFFLEFWPN